MTTLDTVEVWPQRGRGGWYRNQKGQAKLGGRIFHGSSDLHPWNPYDGNPAHGERGQHVHDIAEHADRNKPLPAEFIAHGQSLGMSPELQQYIYDGWLTFLTDHNLTVTHIEIPVACPAPYLVATNIDRIVEHCDAVKVLDIKSAGNYHKLNYLLQGTVNTHPDTRPYDQEADTWLEWDRRPDTDEFYLACFAVYQATQTPPDQWPTWALVKVPSNRPLLDDLVALRDYTVDKTSFVTVEPTTPTPLPSTLEGLRALVGEWEPIDRQQLGELMTREQVDRTNPEQVAAAIERYTFADIATTPTLRPTPNSAPTVEPSVMPDEGPPIPNADFTALSNIYRDYPKPARDWIAELAVDAQHGHVGFHTKDNRTTRRFHIMRALINICEHPNRDSLLTSELAAIHGDTLVEYNPAGLLIGLCDHQQAAALADRLTEQVATS